MAKVFSFIKSNLQGLLIAVLVISFLSETYFFHSNDYIVTTILGYITIVSFAVIQHFEDTDTVPKNIIDQVKSFLTGNRKTKLLWMAAIVVLIAATYYGKLLSCIFFFLIIYYPKRRAYLVESKSDRVKKLKAKGLTLQDIINIEFVKKWDETRKGGVWSYCIKDGALVIGTLLIIPISVLYFIISHKSITQLFPDPGQMLAFIAYTYLSGALIGTIGCRIAWTIKERRFLRLTDPLNTIFTNKKQSFTDLI